MKFFFEAKVSSEDHLLSLPLWYNSSIRIGNRPVFFFYKDWYVKGVTRVEHLWDNSTSFLTWTDFQNKYNLKIRPLDYFGIVSAIKRLQRKGVQHKYECMFTKFLECAKPNRFVYKKLISFKSEQPHSCQEKWNNGINLPQDEKIDWSAAYHLAFQCTKNSKLINFKFLHRRLATNNFLKKIGVVDNEKCSFCQSETKKLLHVFWKCEKTRAFAILRLRGCKLVRLSRLHTSNFSLTNVINNFHLLV